MGQKSHRELVDASSFHGQAPDCFGTLRQHVIICNECSKQFDCLKKYNLHKIIFEHA
jgi:hypothetical protein